MSKSIEAIREALAVAQGILDDPSSTSTHLFQAHESFRETATLLAIAELLAELDAALSRASEVEAQTIERCAKECDEMARQFLPANFDHSDDAEECRRIRQMALNLAAAIRSMRPTGDSGAAEADTRAYSEDGFDLTPTKSKD